VQKGGGMNPVNWVSNTLENSILNHNTDTKWVKFWVLHERLSIVYYKIFNASQDKS